MGTILLSITNHFSIFTSCRLNNGQKTGGKPIIIKSSDFTHLLKTACNKLKCKLNKSIQVYDKDGNKKHKIEEFQQGEEVFIAPKGEDFIPVDTKKKKPSNAPDLTHVIKHEKSAYEEEQVNRQKVFIKVNTKKLSKMPIGMNEIFDGLYVGSARDAMDEEQLKENRITHVLNCALGWNKQILECGIQYGEVLMDDVQHEKLIPHFDRAFAFIDAAKTMNDKARILVRCMVRIGNGNF